MDKTEKIILKPHEVLFHENDLADCLYVVKRGMIRLYRPKAHGRIEVAVIHTGEIIGEMAFFEEGKGRRSCSAESVIETELAKVTFDTFKKVSSDINPWYRTIINTLISRLNTANSIIKQYENNSVTLSYGKRTVGHYSFFKEDEIVKLFSIFYLGLRAYSGEVKSSTVPGKLLEFYTKDVFNISEVKFHEFLSLLSDIEVINVDKDKHGNVLNVKINDVTSLQDAVKFYSHERHLSDDKKIVLGRTSIELLSGILDKNARVSYSVDKATVNIQTIVDSLKSSGVYVDTYDYSEAVKYDLIEEPYLDSENNLVCRANISKIKELLPVLRITSMMNRINEEKRLK